MKNYLHECTVLTIKTTIWKTSKKEKMASIPGQISKQAWKIEARTKDGRLILQEYICDIRDVESNSFGGKFIGPREGKPSILHPRSKKKKEMEGSLVPRKGTTFSNEMR